MKTKNVIVGAKSFMLTLSFSKVASPCHSEKGNEIMITFFLISECPQYTLLTDISFISSQGEE